MVEILPILISAFLGFLLGMIVAVLKLNHASDASARKDVIDLIDSVIASCQERYTSETQKQHLASMRFDYQIRSLVDNTTLLPIIGRTCFDGEYRNKIGELYKATTPEPRELDQAKAEALIKRVNAFGVDIKKIVETRKGNLRLMRKS